MAQSTKILGLRKPEENDYYNQQTEQFENWDKVDSAFEEHRKHYGADWGGYIQDSASKVAGKYYIDNLNNGIYMCIKSGDTTINSVEYFRDDSHSSLRSKIDALDVKKFTVFRATPVIPDELLLYGTQVDGVIQLDYSVVPSDYFIIGVECQCDSSRNNSNFAYGSPADSGRFRFQRLSATYGFLVHAYAIRLK